MYQYVIWKPYELYPCPLSHLRRRAQLRVSEKREGERESEKDPSDLPRRDVRGVEAPPLPNQGMAPGMSGGRYNK